MRSMYRTGNPIVDASAALNISGNVIPQTWYKTITKDSGKPYLTAIVILADIVYWYKPAEVRDEGTGQVIAMKQKFSADLLQRNYQQLSEEFGISKKEATNAIVLLEKLGVVKRVFRKINLNGLVLNNVLCLELIVDRLRELTYPDEDIPAAGKREMVSGEGLSSNYVMETHAKYDTLNKGVSSKKIEVSLENAIRNDRPCDKSQLDEIVI